MKNINWHLIFAIIISVLVLGIIFGITIPTMIIDQTYIHYHGELNTSDMLQIDATITLIKEKASNGLFAILSPDYTILTKTTGNLELDYDFYSKQKNLPLDYYQK